MAEDDDVRRIIKDALAKREVIGILYHGGSDPGGYREIIPLRITLKGKLQALCMATKAVKLFVFAKIEPTPLRKPE